MRARVLITMWIAMAAAAPAEGVRMATWSTLTDRQLSPALELVREREGGAWHHAETARVLVHAPGEREAESLAREADYALAEAVRRLGLPPPSTKPRIAVVEQAATWEQLERDFGLRLDGEAAHSGREILLKGRSANAARVDRVAHELVHFAIAEAELRLPLWMEEGVATLYGIELAAAWRVEQGLRLDGHIPAAEAADLLEDRTLLRARGYPKEPAKAAAMGRQSMELVALLRLRVGAVQWPGVLRAVSDGEDWRDVLRARYGVPMDELDSLLAAARTAAQHARDF